MFSTTASRMSCNQYCHPPTAFVCTEVCLFPLSLCLCLCLCLTHTLSLRFYNNPSNPLPPPASPPSLTLSTCMCVCFLCCADSLMKRTRTQDPAAANDDEDRFTKISKVELQLHKDRQEALERSAVFWKTEFKQMKYVLKNLIIQEVIPECLVCRDNQVCMRLSLSFSI